MEKELRAKILLVDDEEEFVTNLSERLKLRGMRVKTAFRGEEAVNIVDTENFDAIILDLSMPGMDGITTLKKIRQQHPEAEIIILTGHGSVASSVEAMKLGAHDYLEKPVNINELQEKIGEARDRRIVILQKQASEEIQEILKSKPW